MARKTVIVPEKKEVINKIKEKYNNAEMTDQTALKIASLETTNKILSAAKTVSLVAFVIDLVVPDPVIGVDEAVLGVIWQATKTANKIVNNKIDDLTKNGTAEMQTEEALKLADSLKSVADCVKATGKRFN